MPPKRRAASDTVASSKRFRSTIDESCEEFLCPITYGLPLDPVLAEDGKIYERAAIEDWLKQNTRSPVTNLPMGRKLVPATQVRNVIERMVKSGALPDEKTGEWKQRLADQEKVVELKSKAADGNADAACELGIVYGYGKMGVVMDQDPVCNVYQSAFESKFFLN